MKDFLNRAWELFAKSGPLVSFMFLTHILLIYGGWQFWLYATNRFDELEKQVLECQKERSNDLKSVIDQNTRALERFSTVTESKKP